MGHSLVLPPSSASHLVPPFDVIRKVNANIFSILAIHPTLESVECKDIRPDCAWAPLLSPCHAKYAHTYLSWYPSSPASHPSTFGIDQCQWRPAATTTTSIEAPKSDRSTSTTSPSIQDIISSMTTNTTTTTTTTINK